MTHLGPDRVGFFLRHHREELTRIWRQARAAARPELFPGLLDGLVPSFFDTCGELLVRGSAPDEVWSALTGVVRWPPGQAAAEVKTEWALLADVVAATVESIGADAAVAGWLRDAAHACRDGIGASGHARATPPPGVLFAVVYSPLQPPRSQVRHEPNA